MTLWWRRAFIWYSKYSFFNLIYICVNVLDKHLCIYEDSVLWRVKFVAELLVRCFLRYMVPIWLQITTYNNAVPFFASDLKIEFYNNQ